MTLVDEGKLSLDDPLERFIPAFGAQRLWDGSTPSAPILIRHIMNHSSGLVDAIPDSFLATDYSLEELVIMGAAQPLAFPPGARWAYGNLGLNALGLIIEILSGSAFHQFIRRRVLEPLGMKDSFFVVPRARAHRIAAAYATVPGGFVREELPHTRPTRFVSPSNGLYSTAPDLARFLQMLLGKGAFAGRRILSPLSAETMVTSNTGDWNAGFIPGSGYGLGCSVITKATGMFQPYSAGTFGHGGYYQTHIWADPTANLVSIVLCQHRCPQPVSDEVATFIARSPGIM
jgi:CubicO group peptidase (beta-lactamase class C family)